MLDGLLESSTDTAVDSDAAVVGGGASAGDVAANSALDAGDAGRQLKKKKKEKKKPVKGRKSGDGDRMAVDEAARTVKSMLSVGTTSTKLLPPFRP